MCGIAGSFAAPWFNVERALDRIQHRGPDGRGSKAIGQAVHGHVRLALLDLTSASDQPFVTDTGNVLTFNGEVWNFATVRADLQMAGHVFRTTGDTEVLATAIEHYGLVGALERLEGMFAFAWSDAHSDVLVRDRFGKIPLYVSRSGESFAWSSERKGFPSSIPCRPLPPASILDLRSGVVRTYYTLPAEAPANEPLADILERGVRARIVSDAPLCVLISGGLDSSLILTLVKRHKPDVVAYTAVLDTDSPDLHAAERLCAELDVPLRKVQLAPPSAESFAEAARAIEIQSKAQVEIAALCLPLAKRIASDGFKACLSGEAADELFGGYGSMCIKGSRASDTEWRAIRIGQLEKMARGNFIRCNLAFMVAGVECRLPFMERELVETVLGLSKAECPPGKGALKAAAVGIVPPWVIKRPKDTFQGASGMARAAESLIGSPKQFYRAEVRNAYGKAAVAVAR